MSGSSSLEGKIFRVQLLMQEKAIDGWLLYSYRGRNAVLEQLLPSFPKFVATFPVFYWIPAQGNPIICMHERDITNSVHALGTLWRYRSWKERVQLLSTLLGNSVKIATEFSSKGFVPQASFLDAGFYTLIKSFGIEIVSSENLFSEIMFLWSQEEVEEHIFAAHVLQHLCVCLSQRVRCALMQKSYFPISDVQNYINQFICDAGCALVQPAGIHLKKGYWEKENREGDSSISWGDYFVFDVTCKKKGLKSPCATLARGFFLGDHPEKSLLDLFQLAKRSQRVALEFIQQRSEDKQEVFGWEVDRIVRDFVMLADDDYGFFEPLGHSLGVHSFCEEGYGLDDFEYHDTRRILEQSGFFLGPSLCKGLWSVNVKTSVYFSGSGKLFLTTGEQVELYTCSPDKEARVSIFEIQDVEF